MAQLPNRIREWRKVRGWTMENLAHEIGCSIPQVGDLERGNRPLTVEWMVKIARAIEVKPADLLLPEQNSASLRPDEHDLIDRFRRADPAQRQQIVRMVEILIPNPPIKRSA